MCCILFVSVVFQCVNSLMSSRSILELKSFIHHQSLHTFAIMPASACVGIFRSDELCTLSRANPGEAISIRGPCGTCGEMRCRTHCRCGRHGEAVGRSAGRPSAKAKAKAKTKARPTSSRTTAMEEDTTLALNPVGRQPGLGLEVLPVSTWWTHLLEEVQPARSIVLATYMFDHTALHTRLLACLRGGAVLTVLVDREAFQRRTAVQQRPRLLELHRAGAQGFICRGEPPLGCFHVKALCLDRRVVFTGSANFTHKSSRTLNLDFAWLAPL